MCRHAFSVAVLYVSTACCTDNSISSSDSTAVLPNLNLHKAGVSCNAFTVMAHQKHYRRRLPPHKERGPLSTMLVHHVLVRSAYSTDVALICPSFLFYCVLLVVVFFTASSTSRFACHSFKMPSPSLFLGSSTTLVSALLLLSSSVSAISSYTHYALDTEYSGSSFFDGFNFYAVWGTSLKPVHVANEWTGR